ncbi:MAG: glycoside hydrolase family 5 protein [Ruminococcus sp.]|nr:glycoside hydrolase family 5 protein [Ruminococcus sp.]
MLKSKGYLKGINLGGWLSQCDYSEDRLNNFMTEPDFEIISSWGFDHVRIPFDYNVIQNEDGSPVEDGYARIDKAISYARKYGLKVVLDLHKTAGFSFDVGEGEKGFFDSEEYQEKFYLIWDEVAKRYGTQTDDIIFELLNEVTDAEFIDSWNRIVKKCMARIRKYAPDMLVIVGSYNNNAADTVQYLDAPYDDKVVYTFHCYEPLKFTHQGAYWTDKIIPEERVAFEESGTTEEYFENLFSTAFEKAAKHGADLYCGEYGMIDIVNADDSLKWFKVIQKVFEKHNVSRCVWTYKEMDFGLSDSRFDGRREELIASI